MDAKEVNMVNRSDSEKLSIYNILRDVERRLLESDQIPLDWAVPRLQAVGEGREFVPSETDARVPPRRTRAEKRRQWFETWYHKLGFTGTAVPMPSVSNGEFKRKEAAGKKLFYRPPTSEISYDAFMSAVGQATHWTVVHNDRHKIVWEAAETGYWFWAEVADDCPRIRMSWNNLFPLGLLSLEEYFFVWHAHKAQTKKLLDRRTWTMLRTRYKYYENALGALNAGGCVGGVGVYYGHPDYLSCAYDDEGGRLAEVDKIVA
jgi:hypothetical protein